MPSNRIEPHSRSADEAGIRVKLVPRIQSGCCIVQMRRAVMYL